MKTFTLALLILLAVIALGGWKSVRNSFGREAVHQITRTLFKK